MQSIGERLEEARKRKGISIREASEATKIRGDYLHKFESNQFDIKLPNIYQRGFLKLYANFLKLPGEKIMLDFDALALGEGGRPGPKGVNREVYGKIEITHSTASGNRATATPSAAGTPNPAATDPSAPPKRQSFQSTMPLSGLGRALETKSPWMLIIASVVIVGLVAWGIIALVGGSSTPSPKPLVSAQPEAAQVILIATRTVQIISVKGRLDGAELAAPRTLLSGERYALPNADMLVSVSDRAAVQFSFKEGTYDARDARTGVLPAGPGVLTLNFTAQR